MLSQLFETWNLAIGSSRGKIIWILECLCFFLTIWVIWKESNESFSEGKATTVGDLMEKKLNTLLPPGFWSYSNFVTF